MTYPKKNIVLYLVSPFFLGFWLLIDWLISIIGLTVAVLVGCLVDLLLDWLVGF